MSNRLIFLIIFIILVIFVLREKIVNFLFYIHLYLNKLIGYAYYDQKKSNTGYWSSEQRNTHVTCDELKLYLSKIEDEKLYAYNVYQIEGEGKNLFNSIKGDMDTIMGLPIKKIKEYLSNLK